MKRLACSLILMACVTMVWAEASETAEAEAGRKAFAAANQLMKEGKTVEALAKYREARVVYPNATGVLYNGGTAAFLCGEYDTALDFWKSLGKLDPNDWQVRTKIIQTYAAKGMTKERDAEREALYSLRSKTEDKELKAQKRFCREQWACAGGRVFVYEHFELAGPMAVKYQFIVADGKGTQSFTISLGSYDATNELAKQLGRLKKGERAYHLDGYYSYGHRTFAMYHGEPSYDDVRKTVIEILDGKREAISGTNIPARK